MDFINKWKDNRFGYNRGLVDSRLRQVPFRGSASSSYCTAAVRRRYKGLAVPRGAP
jgi:hypothetical protein